MGTVTGITATEVNVDLGTKHAGYIPLSELSDDPTVKPEDIVKVGDEIETYVMRVNDVEGVATLSKKRLDTVKHWDMIEAAVEDKTIMEGVITEDNKGGVVANVKGIRVFIPASQTGMPRGADLSEMIKQQVKLRITEVNRSRRRVVGSIRAVQAEERAAKAAEVWENIEVGKRYEGTVKSLTSYGAFVDIGGVDGMVHVSELSWSRIKNPAEVVSVGDQVSVYVISFDPEKKKISLGMKDRSQDPWEKFTSTYEVGSTATVRVVKLMTFGAFAEIVPGVDGLIHISQIADHRIEKPGDVLEEGQTVDVKITDIDYERKKVSLSIRALLGEQRVAVDEAEADEDGEIPEDVGI
jgi:4-hydroxy-3-methylbut-2-enyl diphosphate reductase